MKNTCTVQLVREPELEFENLNLNSAAKIYKACKDNFVKSLQEKFAVAFLNVKLDLIEFSIINVGAINESIVDIQQIARIALLSGASRIVLIHNHPSNTTKPSDQDIKITKKISQALRLFDIDVIDHIIICAWGYYSFADHKIMVDCH